MKQRDRHINKICKIILYLSPCFKNGTNCVSPCFRKRRKMIAEVIIQSNVKNLNRAFDYQIPEEYEGKERELIGARVLVPFGRMKALEEGFVIGIKQSTEFKVKEIAKVQEKYLDESKIVLAEWMAKRYFCNVSDCLKLMLPPGTTAKVNTNRTKEKSIQFVSLKKDAEEIEWEIENGKLKSDKQIRALRFLMENEEALVADIEMFADASRAVVNTLCKNGYVEIEEKKVERDPFEGKEIVKTEKLPLTAQQQAAWSAISDSMDDMLFSEFLIFGVTGSGKTEIYLQLIEKALKEEKTSILLVPEISLTPQTVNRFIARFGKETIAVLHSKLSVGERYDQWHKIKEGKAKIIIGARSAIFAPVENLGIVIIDEEHDSSYKSEMAPRYDAKEIARYICKEANVPLVLGSATPDMETYYRAKKEEVMLLPLTKRANEAHLPEIEIIDLREELAKGNKSMLSTRLYEEIEKNLQEKKQTILYLNRRGFSTFVMCRNCGYTVKCKHCNINLTYHSNTNRLKCHYCGYEEKLVTECPECGSKQIRYFGTGTQKLEYEIKQLFPSAKTIRMDIDTVSKKNSHEQILTKFKNENIDILIGTQMVVKGHDFPNVTLVGVIAADGSLNMDDFRANEKTFQILTQVAGRAGRGKDRGRVIIQTYNPDNFSIECAKEQNYELFYETEIGLRKQLKYPPFCDIILIGFSSENAEEVAEVAEKIHAYLKNRVLKENIGIILYKALPSPIDRIKNKYRYRILIKCKFSEDIIGLVNDTMEQYYALKKKNTRITIDVNPTNMMTL